MYTDRSAVLYNLHCYRIINRGRVEFFLRRFFDGLIYNARSNPRREAGLIALRTRLAKGE